MYKILICSFLLLAPRITMAASTGRDKRPNIIFLFADDQRADTIGVHGNPHIQTPNLDRLAAEVNETAPKMNMPALSANQCTPQFNA